MQGILPQEPKSLPIKSSFAKRYKISPAGFYPTGLFKSKKRAILNFKLSADL